MGVRRMPPRQKSTTRANPEWTGIRCGRLACVAPSNGGLHRSSCHRHPFLAPFVERSRNTGHGRPHGTFHWASAGWGMALDPRGRVGRRHPLGRPSRTGARPEWLASHWLAPVARAIVWGVWYRPRGPDGPHRTVRQTWFSCRLTRKCSCRGPERFGRRGLSFGGWAAAASAGPRS
jgi:hypothetical protein